jgi:methionine-rich copper-binding protein CopC
MKTLGATLVALLCALVLLPAVALAHANLTSCSIKNHETFTAARAPHSIKAGFAEELVPNKSWMAVFEGRADHGLVNEKTRSVVNFRNPKQMTLKLPKLRTGPYYLMWYTVSALDGHKAAGVVYFTVK